MNVEDSTIIFNSDIEHYLKEFTGLKSNTIREITNSEMLKANLRYDAKLRMFFNGVQIVQYIIIRHGVSCFRREITDVCKWKGDYLISWKD